MIGALATLSAEHFAHAVGLDTPQSPDWGSVVQQLAQQFASLMTTILNTIDSTVVLVARLAYVTVLLLGVLLYFTRIERRLGKDLIKGGIVLAIISEIIIPALSRL